ncbi:hypothetical protein [Flavobacterium capsici]|uniref:Uncharacterized protein n=1 Tax=Flavobacterium capsici TaxID=3075618 RepID=A0AA96ESF4_9FLAO|nr:MULTISPECIES: hypothetical protein [unclassified Flavobacterium]WNM17779.1 hypothetical protein RN608_07105 [Flavobacterium sp. PMR2A8]WNM21832.1 hypothetical protein RN605_00405 [Flavobacterium sp. PMTSA4]
MKSIYTCLFLFACFTLLAQKQYTFDYMVEYKNFEGNDNKKQTKIPYSIYLTNSKNNSYLAELTEKDSLTYWVDFLDHNSTTARVTINKSDFKKTEFIHIKCEDVKKYSNPYKYQVNNYHFTTPKDTIINNAIFKTYSITANDLKRQQKKKTGTYLYIVDKETDFHLPIFQQATTFEEYKVERGVPNGIFTKIVFIDYLNKIKYHQERVNYLPIDKKIVIPADCN